jgi:hypothetical protein
VAGIFPDMSFISLALPRRANISVKIVAGAVGTGDRFRREQRALERIRQFTN